MKRFLLRASIFVAIALLVQAWRISRPFKPLPATIAVDTTFVTGPLDADGYVDYETALNDHMRGSITPESNALVLIWQALGPKPEGGNGLPDDYFKALGCERSAESPTPSLIFRRPKRCGSRWATRTTRWTPPYANAPGRRRSIPNTPNGSRITTERSRW